MAKLKAPLFSLGASQQLGKALVFFPWKGLNVVREYVIPANPRTALQNTQRGYLSDAVDLIHTMMAHATLSLDETDKSAYALWASVVKAATTWFNQAVKNYIDQVVAGLNGIIYGQGSSTPGANQLAAAIHSNRIVGGGVTAGDFFYGTSKTALLSSQVAVINLGANRATATLAGLTTGVKYFWQFRPSAPAGYVGGNSGIYYGYPT